MPKMLKENTKRRKWINIRVTKDFQLIDMHFQRYCIENNINETKKIRQLIQKYLEEEKAIPKTKIDEY